MLGTDPQAPPDGAQLRADVTAQDVGSARGGWEQACQDGPVDQGGEQYWHLRVYFHLLNPESDILTWWWSFLLRCVPGRM